MIFVRSPFNYDMDAASAASGFDGDPVSRTKQSFADEVDINTIVNRFGLGYEPPEGLVAPVYQDFTGIGDFHSAMNAVRQAADMFMEMPADLRARVGNDPGRFVDFCADPANRPELERLGVAVPHPKQQDLPAVPAAPAPAPSPAPNQSLT